MNLRKKILLLLLCVALLPVLLTGYAAYYFSRKSLENETVAYLSSANAHRSSRIIRWIENAKMELEYLAMMPVIHQSLGKVMSEHVEFDTEHEQKHRDLVHDYLQALVSKGRYNEIFLIRPDDGVVLLSTDIFQEGKIKQDRPYFRRGLEKTSIQNIYYSMAIGEPVMTISTPVRDENGKLLAVMAGRPNLHDLSEILEEGVNAKASEDAYLVNAENFFITEPRFGKSYALHRSVYTHGVRAALSGESGTAQYTSYQGRTVIGAFTFMAEWNIALITEIDRDEYLAPIRQLQQMILFIGFLMAALALLIGWRSADMLLRPLARLVDSVNALDADNLIFEHRFKGSDEIATLASAFAGVTGRLRSTLVSKEELLREIGIRRETERQLTETMTQLQNSNRELEQFAYVASHDLQEPLRMVSSFVQLLSDRYQGQLDDKAQKYINYAVDGAMRMQVLIHDLLEFSRVSTRGSAFARTASEEIVTEAISNLNMAIDESGAVITHEELPEIFCDRRQIVQVFQNLIANAIKFCTRRPPVVHIGTKPDSEAWFFWVRDNGIGIESRYAEKIFVIFQRLHSREEYPGTGIGLALCKRIIERHGGRIWFESEPGSGTTFFFTLPKDKSAEQNA